MAKREPTVRLEVYLDGTVSSGMWKFRLDGTNLGEVMMFWEHCRWGWDTRAKARRAGEKVQAALKRAKFV